MTVLQNPDDVDDDDNVDDYANEAMMIKRISQLQSSKVEEPFGTS